MKKIIILFLILTVFVFYSFAADFGLTVDSNAAVEHTFSEAFDWSGLTYTVKAALWGNASLVDDATVEFQGSYTFSDSRAFTLELDQLQLTGTHIIPGENGDSTLLIKVGRFPFSDFSAKVFSHTGDGFSLALNYPLMSVSAFTAYTGFLQQPSSAVLMSESDIADIAIDSIPMFGPLASPRIVEGLNITFPELFAKQTLVLSGVFQQDMREVENLTAGGNRLNTYYAGGGIMGPLFGNNSLFHSVYGYGNFGSYGSNTILAYIAGGSLNYFMPAILSSRLSLDFMYASGDADHTEFYEGNTAGYSEMFVPITPAPAGIIFTAQQSNLFYISGAYSLKPFVNSDIVCIENTLVMLKPIVFFRSTTATVSSGGVLSDSSDLYLGTEVDLILMARFLSDLGLSIGSGIFFPSAAMETSSFQIKGSIALSLSI